MTSATQSDLKRNLIKPLLWACVLIVVDAFLLNQGLLSALVGFWMLFVSFPRAVLTKAPEQRHRLLARVAILLCAVMLVFSLNWVNNQIAQQRAETLITAIKAFNQRYQRYPDKLDELVPDFIDHVPAAKYTFQSASFHYSSSAHDHSLFYVAMPSFGRPIYSFEKDQWEHLD